MTEEYKGADMIGFMSGLGWSLRGITGDIKSMTNVRDTAVIVTDYGIWRARPCPETGFYIECVAYL